MSSENQPERQRDVQRLLGRCMLRLQQYERLMKTMLAYHELAGPLETLEAQRESRVQKLSDKSLGTLVKALFETYAVPDGFERDLIPEDRIPTDRISMAFSFRIAMPPERLAEVRAGVEELVRHLACRCLGPTLDHVRTRRGHVPVSHVGRSRTWRRGPGTRMRCLVVISFMRDIKLT